MTTLLLVRHGQSVDNVNQIMQGQTQGRLSDEGIRQAQELAMRLQHEPIDAFVSSDLHRAIETCTILARPHGKSVETTALLRERDWGSFTGRYIPSLKGEPWADDIESLDDLMDRAARFLQFVKDRYPGQRVVAVGHGIINKAVQAVYYHRQMRQIEKMDNCEIRELRL